MKKSLFILFLGFLAFASQPAMAQFDAQLTNYWATTGYFNPGSAGNSGQLELTALSRLQWLGVEGAPRTILILANMPFSFFGREHGVGASMYNESIGLFSTTVMSAQYAYKTKLFKGNLGIGLQAGYIQEKFDGSKVYIPEDEFYNANDDANPGVEVSGSSIDASFGIFYSRKNWYAGLSATHLLAPQLTLNETQVLDIPRHYYFTAGYNIPLNNSLLELRPSILVKTMEVSSFYIENDTLVPTEKGNALKGMLTQTQVDISLLMLYKKTFWGGITWRKQDAVALMLGGKIKGIEVGYAYDYPISVIRRGTWGSHELFIRYSMDMGKKKPVRNKHKSVRIL
ncbi:MAG: type IX secretion system membrane protein PorP/SprF [Dysgonamonadaceae bacterium]|jgi:type IX secretion system PorP/SprF family membrane protein|nr:type IX secretion system membrane protein PorP/SprF [Dysgonamonadaceae bacterium]